MAGVNTWGPEAKATVSYVMLRLLAVIESGNLVWSDHGGPLLEPLYLPSEKRSVLLLHAPPNTFQAEHPIR